MSVPVINFFDLAVCGCEGGLFSVITPNGGCLWYYRKLGCSQYHIKVDSFLHHNVGCIWYCLKVGLYPVLPEGWLYIPGIT